MELDDDGLAPSPLQPMVCWPRQRGRRQRFNLRQLECHEEPSPPNPVIESTGTDRRVDGVTTPIGVLVEGPPNGQPSEESALAEDPSRRPSVFSRLRWTQTPATQQSPDRFPDLRLCPTRGMLFGDLPSTTRPPGPLPRACFNCRRRGHSWFECRKPLSVYCYNCGRRGQPSGLAQGAERSTRSTCESK